MTFPRSTTRRDFLRFAGLGAALFGLGAERALGADTRGAGMNRPGAVAKNVIFLVADGMNVAVPSLADIYLRNTTGTGSRWMRMYREMPVVRSLCETHSLSGPVTDSAAAASAWGIGRRVINGSINVLPDGSRPETLCRLLHGQGMKTGLVTTVTATHATPAGFLATVDSRGDQQEIARQYLEHGVDVVMGGGAKHFPPKLLEAYRAAGYTEARDAESLAAHDGTTSLLGLFTPDSMPYEIDRTADPVLAARVPSLAAMTRAALQRLRRASNGFFLMVEAGRVDQAAHANDGPAILRDQIAFDEALGVALEFMDGRDDTLLIVTTDHGTGGLQLNGVGSTDFYAKDIVYAGSGAAFERVCQVRASIESMVDATGAMSRSERDAYVLDRLAFALSDAEKAAFSGVKSIPDLMAAKGGLGWTSHYHTADLVEFSAMGPGASLFRPLMRNDEVRGHLLRALGVA